VKNGSIYFIGCSFTWGQNLYYKKWLSNVEEELDTEKVSAEQHSQFPSHRWLLSSDDYIYLYKNRWSSQVGDGLNMHSVYKLYNGGENFENIKDFHRWMKNYDEWLKTDDVLLRDRKLKLVVFQATVCSRSPQQNKEEMTDEDFVIETAVRIKKLSDELKNRKIPFILWSWNEDIAMILKDEDFFLKLPYNGKEHISFNGLVDDGKQNRFFIDKGEFNPYGDGHPSQKFNDYISELIVDKYKRGLEV
jgi:hypothetical protein